MQIFSVAIALLIASNLPSAFAISVKPGEIVRVQELSSISPEEIDELREEAGDEEGGDSKDRVRLFRIIYYTTGIRGGLETASGLAMLPMTKTPLPLISMQHKAIGLRTSAPSFKLFKGESLTALIHFASKGYAVLQPDGLGLGQSSAAFNPFLHSDTEAASGKNFIIAAKKFAESKGVRLNGDLFLVGYSQGGHWTMAIHRELERNPVQGLTVVASAPMGAPLDLSGTCLPILIKKPGITSPTYAASLLNSYQQIYGGLFNSWSEAFQSPYDKRVPQLFDGYSDLLKIYLKLPRTPRKLLQPEYFAAIENQPNHRFRQLLEQNNLYDWAPRAPILLVHAITDATSPVANSVKAAEYMSARGSTITLRLLKGKLSHSEAFYPAVEIARDYFKSIRLKNEGTPLAPLENLRTNSAQ